MDTNIELIILILGTWRLASLLAHERGPYDIFLRLRLRLGTKFDEHSNEIPTNMLTDGITCVWCNSIWLAVAGVCLFALFRDGVLWLYLPFAISAGAIIIEKVLDGKS